MLLLVAALAACEVVRTDTPSASSPTPIVAATPSPTPLSTTVPPPTPTPHAVTLTPTATATPEPTATLTPTATATADSGTWRGLVVAAERRCSPYDADDYRLFAVRRAAHRCKHGRHHLRPVYRNMVRQHIQDRHRAHRRTLRGPRQRSLRSGCRNEAAVRLRPAEPDVGQPCGEPFARRVARTRRSGFPT